MSVASMIAASRTRVEDTFVDQGAFTRPGDGGVLDEVTGEYTPTTPIAVWAGRCRVKKPNQVEQQTIFGDEAVSVARYLVNVPFDVPELKVDDVFVITASDDAELVGTPMRVAVVVGKSVLMYRQVGCEVVE